METKRDIIEQLKYMMENKELYLSLNNPHKITEEEFNKRIRMLKEDLQ